MIPPPAPRAVALVPARAGSKRLPGKNVRCLAGHPLLAYTIAAAQDSGVFARVVVSTDCDHTAAIARHYGADVPFVRPRELAGDLALDVAWVGHALEALRAPAGPDGPFEAFAILRPTSPFRQADTIRRAWRQFVADLAADSLRAVQRCSQHPGKMWLVRGQAARRLVPLLPFAYHQQPWHSHPTQALEEVYVQNASLEIAWTRTVTQGGSIAGEAVLPFLTQGYEGLDINQPDDWDKAEQLVRAGKARLPAVAAAAWGAQEVPPAA